MNDELEKKNDGEQPSEIAELRETVVAQKLRIDELQKKIDELTRQLLELKSPEKPCIILPRLPENQRAVLQAILDLPEDAFSEAEKLIATLEGQPFSEAYSKSFSLVLREKKWLAVCTCGKPAAVYWHKDNKYAENGRAFFSHTGNEVNKGKVQHGSLTRIPHLKFVKRIDKRLKSTETSEEKA